MLKQTIANNPLLTPDLIQTAQSAFESYLVSKLVKCLPSPVDAPSASASPLDHFEAIVNRDQTDEAWAAEARAKEEKFGMHIASLTRARDAIRIAGERHQTGKDVGAEAVRDLVDGAAEILGPHLGTTVCRSFPVIRAR